MLLSRFLMSLPLLLKPSGAVKRTQVDAGSHLNVSPPFSTTGSSSARLYHLENDLVQLQTLWKSQWQGVHSSVPQPLSAFHLCFCCNYMSFRGRGEIVSVGGCLYAQAGKEVLEVCDGAQQLLLLLFQRRDLLLQLTL